MLTHTKGGHLCPGTRINSFRIPCLCHKLPWDWVGFSVWPILSNFLSKWEWTHIYWRIWVTVHTMSISIVKNADLCVPYSALVSCVLFLPENLPIRLQMVGGILKWNDYGNWSLYVQSYCNNSSWTKDFTFLSHFMLIAVFGLEKTSIFNCSVNWANIIKYLRDHPY